MIPKDQNPPKKELMISYLQLRRLIGILGISLPFTLALGTFIINCFLCDGREQAIQPSISHYYYSIMHVVFVGVLCLLSGFLFCYPGPHRHDKLISTLAGFFALGVAAFPTNCQGFLIDNEQYINLKWWAAWVNWVHYGSALGLFGCFAFFCFCIFQEDDSGCAKDRFDDKKKSRNKFYKGCGIIILVSIIMIGALTLYERYVNKLPCFISTYNTIFFETIALLAFGSSWLLKGTYQLAEMPKVFVPLVKYYR
jgi:hypothetical protein